MQRLVAIIGQAPDDVFDPEFLVAPTPRSLWMELTSRCPFDCIFCSRRLLRGDGEHMDFALYKNIIQQLDRPEVIRLNYSGESIHHPYIVAAVRLAKSTGATVELVSAFATVSPAVLKGLVDGGLDRLTISLHSMDPAEYRRIYRFSSLQTLQARIADLQEYKHATGSATPRIDFAFVAMKENLHELPRVTVYAKDIGVTEVFVHPVIKRDPIPYDFSRELGLHGKLTDDFKRDLRPVVEAAQLQHPESRITVSNPDTGCDHRLGPVPQYFPSALPQGARISGCDQDPWESVHILANGDVVPCEVQDKAPLGNLRQQTMRQVWHGERYRQFRRDYTAGLNPHCRECPWKIAHLPSPLQSTIAARDGSPQLVRGWYPPEGGDIIWSRREGLAVLKKESARGRIRIRGVLPHPDGEKPNVLGVECNGRLRGRVVNVSEPLMHFDSLFDFHEPQEEILKLKLTTDLAFCPSRLGINNDSRVLGFALCSIEVLPALPL